MDSVNQPELPPAGHHSVLTSDTSLLTRTSYTTTPDIDDLFSGSRSTDTTSPKSPTHHRFSIKPPKITTVDSLLSFLHYICLLPEDTLDQLYDFESTIGLLTSDRLVSFCGRGLSFVVQEHPDYKLPDALLKSKGDSQFKSKPSTVAIKIPRIERGESSRPDPSVEGRALRTMAWECHVLSHPPIRQCENIVGIYGLTWRAVFSGHDGTQRLLPSLVMELANEGTLNDLFDPDTYCLSYSLKRKLAMDIATGLEILHKHGIIHGDVKGDNMLLFSDKQGSLTAKVADFGCAVHDFGPLAVKPMPGRSPPWDAPEVRHGPIALPKLHKTDIYSLGLLVWRLMLEGQSPFDNTENSHKFPGFEGIYDAKSRASQLLEIQKLKDSEDDELLQLMKTTLSSRGLDESQLGALFDLTVRHHEKDRTETLKDFLLGFGGGALESLSGRSVGHTNDSISDLRSNSVIHNLIGDGRPTEIAIPAQEFKTDNEFILDRMMRDEFQMSRTFMGSTWEDPYITELIPAMGRIAMPPEVEGQIFKDLIRYPSINTNADIALCYFAGFGVTQDFCIGLKYMVDAAVLGDIRARAIIWRLHQAYNREIPPDLPILYWLAEATITGSRIAASDLLRLNSKVHERVIRICRCKFYISPVRYLDHFSPSSFDWLLSKFDTNYKGSPKDFDIAAEFDCWISKGSLGNSHVDTIQFKSWSLLHFAAMFGSIVLIDRLLDLSSNLDQQNIVRVKPLLCACQSGRSMAAIHLLGRGANACIRDAFGATGLHYLVNMDGERLEELGKALVANGADIHAKSIPCSFKYSTKFFGEPVLRGTALHWAVTTNRVDVVKVLLNLGANALELSDHTDMVGKFDLGITSLPKASMASSVPLSSPFYEAILAAQADMVDLFLSQDDLGSKVSDMGLNPLRMMENSTFEHMCRHGSRFEENFLRTIYLAKPRKSLGTILGYAVHSDSVLLAQDLINKGCDVNLIIPEVELTPLQMSMTRRSGEMTMFLLQNGADPQIRSPNCPVSCMTLLALRPLGSLCREITNQLIQCGITYDTEPDSFAALYRRAVKEEWYDVASDLLANGNVNKAKLEEGLLADLLWQNSEASLGPIMYLFKPQHGYGQASPIVSERKRWTVFHQLARIPEDFRDDELNKRIVNYLIEKFPQLEIFDQKDADGKTALTIAVHNGNRHLIAALLNAGASPYAGNIHALMIIVDRALFPKTFSGGFVGISRRRQRRTRFEHNTVCMLSLLLKHDLEKRLFGASQEDLVDATKILTKWRATEYRDQYITSSLREILGPSVTAEFPQDDLHVRDSESGLSRRATLTEAKHVVTNIWNTMIRDVLST